MRRLIPVRRIPDNVIFVAACNPFQFKRIRTSNENDVFFVHPDKANALTHKVNPVNARMLQCLFDFGSLSKQVEQKYISAMFQDFQGKVRQDFLEMFVESVTVSQDFIKKTVIHDESSLSLRDVKRVKKIFVFYCYFIWFRNSHNSSGQVHSQGFDHFLTNQRIRFKKFTLEELLIAFVVAISMNYLYRIIQQGDCIFSLIRRPQASLSRNHS